MSAFKPTIKLFQLQIRAVEYDPYGKQDEWRTVGRRSSIQEADDELHRIRQPWMETRVFVDAGDAARALQEAGATILRETSDRLVAQARHEEVERLSAQYFKEINDVLDEVGTPSQRESREREGLGGKGSEERGPISIGIRTVDNTPCTCGEAQTQEKGRHDEGCPSFGL